MNPRVWIVSLALAGISASAWAAVSTVEGEHYRLIIPDDFTTIDRLRADAAEDQEPAITRRAWGDLPSGCVAAVHDVDAEGADAEALFEGVLAGLDGRGVRTTETGRSDSGRRYAVSGGVTGMLHIDIGGDPMGAVAALCFWSPRDPEHCQKRCTELLDSVELLP